MEARINYLADKSKFKEIELRLIQVEYGWAVEVNHKQAAPEADFVFVLRMAEAKMLQESLGSFVNMLEWLWKNEKK